MQLRISLTSPLTTSPSPFFLQAFEFLEPQGDKELLQKSAPAVVTSGGLVVVGTPKGTVFGLPNPDTLPKPNPSNPGTIKWDYTWTQTGSEDLADDADCYDLVLDSNDVVYQSVSDRNLLQAFLYAYDSSGNTVPAFGAQSRAALNTNLRLLQLYRRTRNYRRS